ncbi:Mediator of RNA polymerase II transcription subunit 9 [Cladosporium halotolerans]|uniref:Mediator of RNA polymerase II transcription subunit 9 n=1 Tax=Cladosporium halotolerans TaxID=1052096 RepID=A0AB34KU20_9PEZI
MAFTQSFGASTTDASRPSSQSQPEQVPLPPPQTFDILPPLHELLARIDHAPNDPIQAATGDGDVVSYAELQPLEPKDLPNEVAAIKSRIRKALRELEKLPDMGRTTEEQEEEIKLLEEKAVKQREVLRKLGEVAGSKMR